MKKTTLVIVIAIIILVIGVGILLSKSKNVEKEQAVKIDIHDGTYIIDGKSVTLKNGISEVEAALGSASKIVTRYFGNEVKKDLDSDGRQDVAFLVTQNTGGSGTFFYVVANLNTEKGWVGSQGLFLGDRIAPQTTESGAGRMIIVNYAERKVGESFDARPSVGKSLYLLLDPKTRQFGEVVQNFEGEADPARMTLDMNKWKWQKTIYNDGKTVVPKIQDKFTLTFVDSKRFSATTDCNGIGGEYQTAGNKIALTKMMSTLMYCERSQESDFSQMLGAIESYHFTSKGELTFDLKLDSGSMIFR